MQLTQVQQSIRNRKLKTMTTLSLKKSMFQSRSRLALLLIPLVFACFGLLPKAQAVNPPPDGGYGPPAYGTGNTAEGEEALLNLSSGNFNTAAGFRTLFSNTTSNFNTAIGAGALFNNTGDQNTATGAGALLSNTSGRLNTANGEGALFFNMDGTQNTATGAGALESNTTGDLNTANGVNALLRNTTGGFNTADGANALDNNTTGDFNTALGSAALTNNTTGNGNIAIGFQSGHAVTRANNVICIGSNVDGANINNSCYVGNIFTATSSSGVAVFVNGLGKLGTVTSSKRFKEEIKPMGTTSEALFSLTPVAFHYRKEIDPAGTPQLGLVAEDVEKVNPDLVVRDKEGKPYSVRYDQVNAMMLNEFLKEHRKNERQELKIEEQEAKIAHQQKQIEALTAGLQKVSAQLELNKPATQTVLNDR
jgi:hypothetical protein